MALARNIAAVGSGTLISRLLAYLRDAGIAALLGAGPFSEAFFAVLQVVNFFRRLLAEGALNGAFVPIWLKLRAGEDGVANGNRFTKRSLVAMLIITGIVALLVTVLAPLVVATIVPGFDPGHQKLTSFFLLVVTPYIVLAGLVAVIGAALNAEGRVSAVAVSIVAFNLVMLAAAAIAFGANAGQFEITLGLTAAIVAAGLAQLLIAGVAWLMTGRRWQRVRLHGPDQTGVFFKRALPGLIATGIPQLKLIAATAIVSSSPAAVSWLYYANRLYELPLGVASVAIAAVMVPRIAESRRTGGDDAYAAALSRSRSVWRCRRRPVSRCSRRRSPAGCSSTAPSPRATRLPWRPRWSRFAPACPATCWKNGWGLRPLRMRTPICQCGLRFAASPPPLPAACCCFRAPAMSAPRRRSRSPAGSAPLCLG
jgi:putative peptidoglycan lipid II flippase